MKIYTRVVCEWQPDGSLKRVEEDSYDYEGPLALAGFMKADPPPTPDYAGAATAQGAANLQYGIGSQIMNRPNEYTPMGSRTWQQTGTQTVRGVGDQPDVEVPTWESTVSLSPEAQNVYNTLLQQSGGMANLGNLSMAQAQQQLGQPLPSPGQMQTNLGQQGDIVRSFGPYGNPQVQFGINAGEGNIQRGIENGEGNIRSNIDPMSGRIQVGLDRSSYAPISQVLDTRNVAAMPVNAGTTAYQAAMSRLEPQLQAQRQRTETQLINQGLRPGGEAYDLAARNLGQQENDLRLQAAANAIGLDMAANQQGYNQALQSGQFGNQAAGQMFNQAAQRQQLGNQAIGQQFGQNLAAAQFGNQAEAQRYAQALGAARFGNEAEAQRYAQGLGAGQFANQAAAQQYAQNLGLGQFANQAQQQAFTQGLASAQFGNQALGQQLQQDAYLRQLPLNELNALRSGSQVGMPQFQGYGQTNLQAPNYAGAAAQQGAWDQGIYNQQQAANNAFTGGLFDIGAAAMTRFSDIRLKSNIKRVGTHPLGIGIYTFTIGGRHEIGVMAQEVLTVKPEAVSEKDGYLTVDYGVL